MSDDDWDNDEWDAPDLTTIPGSNFDDEEDLSLAEPVKKVVKSVPKKVDKALQVERQKRQSVIDKKEAQEQQRQDRLKAALEAVSQKSGRKLTKREQNQLIVEKSDNLLCEDLFGDLGGTPVALEDVDVLDGEDVMGGGATGGNATTAAAAAAITKPTNPKDAFEDAVTNVPMNDELEHIEVAGLIAAKLNEGKNSTNIVQFIEFLIKAAHPSLDSTQYKALSSACNVQKNLKQKEEQVGKKKKKKASKKKSIKMQRGGDDYMNDPYNDYGDDYADFM